MIGIIPAADPLSRQQPGVSARTSGSSPRRFRQLRTNLRFVDVDKPPRSIVVTSANPHEGKSTVSANLARMMAAAGQPTRPDRRRPAAPSLASTFDLDPTVGLTQVLVGDVRVQRRAPGDRTPNLQRDHRRPDPAEPERAAGLAADARLVEELTQEFMVILDAPPLLPVTDAGLLSGDLPTVRCW